MDYKIDRVKKYTPAYTHPLNCKSEDCPLFSVCPQFKTYGDYLHAKTKIDLLLVFDNPSQIDVEYSIPQVDEAGLMFRKEWLEPFFGAVAMKSYLISHLVRAPLTRNPTTAEMAYCWDHFYAELMMHKPATIVGFGSNIFPQLYMKAKNKEKLPDPNTSVSRLRQAPMDIQFSNDYTAKVFIGYSPNYVGKAPHARKDFHADRDRVIGYLCPSKKIVDDTPYINTENVRLIKTVDEALEVINHLTYDLPKDRFFDLAFDTETENLNRAFNNKFLSWQFTWEENEAVFIPIDHPEMPLFAKIEDKVKLINAFQNLLNRSSEESRISWIVAHNAKFDFSLLYGLFRILPRGTIPIWDTLLGMHWINENRKSNSASYEGKPYSLKTLSTELLGFSYKSEQLAARADGDLVSLPFSELVNYGGTDTILTWHLKQKQMRMANLQPDNALPKLERFMRHYYSPASRAVAFMECNGLYVSNEQLQYLQGEESPIWNRIARIENVELQESPEVRAFRESKKSEANAEFEDDLWGDTVDNTELEPFNPNKKDQETAFYLDFLGLEPLAMSKKTQKPTLNKAFLNHYAAPETYLALDSIKPYLTYYKTPCGQDEEGDPILPKNPLQLILEYRELTKLGNTYLESISEMIQDKNGDCIDNRVRASYWLAGTDTGRLCLRFDSRISVVGDFAKLTPPLPPVKHGIPIKDVKVGDLVFCYDDEGNLQIRKVLWQGKTGTKKLLRLHWSAANNRKTGHLDLTPEHKVRLLDGSYKMAKDLKPDDRLLTLARCVCKTSTKKKNYYSRLYTQKAMIKEHRFVYENVNGSKAQTVHHADGNSLNNHPSNLLATTTSKHTTEHLKEHWENGVFANRPTKGEGHYLWNHQGRFTFLKELARVKGQRKSKEGLASKKLIKNSESFKRRCQLFGIDTRVIRMRYDGQGIYISKGRLQRLLTNEKSSKVISDLKIDYRTLKALLSYYGQEHLIAERNREEGSEGRKHSILRNHVVIKLEELEGFHDVYDLEVEDCHNFIANEICVHNSSSNPNLQNLPSGRSPMAKEIKNLFQAEPPSKRFKQGTALVQLDYKTAEVRWAAIFANDKNLIRLFNEAHESLVRACSPDVVMTNEEFEATQLASDIHRRTASLMYGIEPAKVSKSQRQASKCLVGDTKLFTNKGIVSIESLVVDKTDDNWQQRLEDVTVASSQYKTKAVGINHKWVDSTIRVRTKTGIEIEGDSEHPLLVWQECQLVQKELSEIKVGDYLVVPRTNDIWPSESPVISAWVDNKQDTSELEDTVSCLVCEEKHGNLNRHLATHDLDLQSYRNQFPNAKMVSPMQIAKRMNSLLGTEHNKIVPKYPTKLTPSLAKLLGYLVAEGDGQRYTMSGHADDAKEMLQDFMDCFYECFGLIVEVSEYREFTSTGVIRLPQKVVRYLLDVGLIQGYSETQRVPDIMFRATKSEIKAFLSAYFEGDGSVKYNQIVVMSASSLLMQDIQLLLLSMNIVSNRFKEERITPVGKEVRPYYGLRLSIRDSRLFHEQIGFVSTRKQAQAAGLPQTSSGRDCIYGLEKLLTELKKTYKRGRRWIIGDQQVRFGERITKGGKSEVTRELLTSRPYVLEALKVWSTSVNNSAYRDIKWLLDTKAALIPVDDISVISGRVKVYDIEVDDASHTFIANGLLSKNCITFGLLFGMGVQTLAANNGWTESDTKEKVNMFFAAFPDLKRWLDEIPNITAKKGYVETKMGRRRRLEDLFQNSDFKNRAKAKRLSMNAPIQGQSSDGGIIGLCTFLQYLLDNNLERRWIVQNVVHDSCLVQVPIEDIDKALIAMQHYFVQGMADYITEHFKFTLPLPIECEIEVSLKYGNLTKWDGRPSTLPALIEKIKADAQKLWYTKKDKDGKPPENFDLVKWKGK
jgi:uracil-DNA glycosylase family 4